VLVLFTPFLAALQIVHTGFEGARLERVEQTGPAQFRCHLRGDQDQDSRNRQANWYYFRLDGARGQEVIIDLVSLPGEYNYQPNRGAVTKDTVPVWSEDNLHWQHFHTTEFDAVEPRLRLRVKPTTNQFWIAHVPPYTNRHLQAMLTEFRASPYLKVERKSEMPLLTITDPYATGPKQNIWLMFRQHAWETGSSWAGEGAIRFLLSADPTAAAIREKAVYKIFAMADPTGVRRGTVRFNQAGFDLNRNWDVDNAATMPEIAGQKQAIARWLTAGHSIDLFLTVHNTETSEYLEGPPEGFDELGLRFFAALEQHSTFAPTRPYFRAAATTTVGKPGRMTVSQGLYAKHKIPTFTMEQMIARNPRLGHLPTVEDRLAFGAQLARACFAAVTESIPPTGARP
jgi:Cytosolic carboxypeptidase N-terminal domain/Zinc carboxypeptidase